MNHLTLVLGILFIALVVFSLGTVTTYYENNDE